MGQVVEQTTLEALRIHFDLFPGESLGLVGESGSGKTTVVKCMLRAVDPTSGEVWFHHEGRS